MWITFRRFTLYLLYRAKYYIFAEFRGIKYYIFVDNLVTKGEKACTARSRCDNARECDYCARRKQKRIADKAEKLEQQYGHLAMTVLVPEQNTEAAIRALHGKFMRRALVPAGIWTIETGTQFAGLHLNILSPKPLPARWKNCETYSELLRVTARDAAAYIAKRSGMPTQEQYSGKLYGHWGKIGEILATQEYAPIVQAAALEVAMGGGVQDTAATIARVIDMEYRTDAEEAEGWEEGKTVNGRRVWHSKKNPLKWTWKPPRQNHSKEVRAEIMRAHLPKLYEAVGKSKILTTV